MGYALKASRLSAAEYLAWEAEQPQRHEFVDGEVFAMAGAGDAHVTVAGNLYMALRQHLKGSPCRTYMSDMRLAVAAANCYFYPDVMVTCSAGDHASAQEKREPVLVVEVLSPGTEGFDRGAKFTAYRALASLKEYVLIDVGHRTADVYRKGVDGLWVLHPFERNDVLQLASVELALSMDDVFAEVLEEAERPASGDE